MNAKLITPIISSKKAFLLVFFILFSALKIHSASITINSNVIYSNAAHSGNDITVGSGGIFTINSNAQLNSIKVNNGGTLIINAPYTLTVGVISNTPSTLVVDFQNGSTVTLQSGAFLVVYGLLNNSNNSTGITLNGVVNVFGNVTGGNGSQIVGAGTINATGSITTSGSGTIFGTQNDCETGPCNINQGCGFLPQIPTASVTIQPTCTTLTGTIVITSPLGAGYQYQLNSEEFQSSTTFSGVNSGTHTIKVRLGSSPTCISLPLTLTVNNAPSIPSSPTIGTITQPTCTVATGSVVLNNLPSGTWTLNPGNIAGSGTNYTISGLASGTYNYTVTNASGCTSLASANVVINAQPAIPSIPTVGVITQPTCTISTGSVVLNNLPSGSWTLNPGNIAGSGTNYTISGLASGTYNYTVTNASGCTSLASANVVINAQPAIPSIPTVGVITQPTCTISTGSVVLNNLPSGSWTLNPGNIIGSGTSYTITGLASGTYNYTVTNTSGCTSLASANLVINAQPSTNNWTGAINSDWNNAGNWSCGVPTSSSTLTNLIPSGVPNYPLITSDVTIVNLTIDSEAVLNVFNNGLTLTGLLTLNGKLDLKNESQLIQTSTSTLIADCSYSGHIEIDQQGTPISYYYNYWGSPVYNNCLGNKYSIAGVLRDGSFPDNIKLIDFGFSVTYADTKREPTNDATAIKVSSYWMNTYRNRPQGNYNNWTFVGINGDLFPGEGFTMKGSNRDLTADQNYTFVGKPNNGTITLPIQNNNQYLVGNPYPSALDADKFIDDNAAALVGTLYFWDHAGPDSHYLAAYDIGYATYSKAGGTPAGGQLNTNLPGRKLPKRYIPVAQGFFVNGIANSQIVFNNSQRFYKKESLAIDNSIFIRSTGKSNIKNNEEKDLTKRIYLSFKSPLGYYRTLLAAIIPTTTDGFDLGYDAKNIDNLKEDFYWKLADDNLVIQAVPTSDNRILPLVLKTALTGVTKIGIESLENISAETDIYIRDIETGILHNLRTSTFEVNLNAGIYTNRFELVLQPQKTLEINEENLIENTINIYLTNNNSVVFISNPSLLEIKEISVYNMIGQRLLLNNKILDKNSIELPFNFESGVYVVTVKTNQGISTKKVLKY